MYDSVRAAAVAATGLGLEAKLRVKVGLAPTVLSGLSKHGLFLLLQSPEPSLFFRRPAL